MAQKFPRNPGWKPPLWLEPIPLRGSQKEKPGSEDRSQNVGNLQEPFLTWARKPICGDPQIRGSLTPSYGQAYKTSKVTNEADIETAYLNL